MANDKEIALYYPYIDIDDTSLIKTAALYWDEIQTIVPLNYDNPYKTETSQTAYKEGFLNKRKVRWDDEEIEKAGKEFVADLRNDNVLATLKKISQVKNMPRYTSLNVNKIGLENKKSLEELLRAKLECDADGFFDIPAVIAHVYMTRLSTLISQADGSIPLTNVSGWHDTLIDRYVNYDQECKDNQAQLAKMSLQSISIAPDVSLEEILNFRKDHKQELCDFRSSIRKLTRQVGTKLNEADRQKDLKEIVNDELLPVRAKIEAKLKESDIKFSIQSLFVAIPAILGNLSADDFRAQIVVLTSGFVGIVGLYIYSLYEDRNILKNHPFGYLYQAQQHFGVK